MALRRKEGFDHYKNATDFARGKWSFADLNASAPFVTGRFGGKAANLAQGSTYGYWNPKRMGLTLGAPIGTPIVGIAHCAPSGGLQLISFIDGTTYQCYVIIDTTSGIISAYRGDPSGSPTLLGSSYSGIYTPGAWQYLEAKLVVASGTSGSIIVRVNNGVVLSVSGINTKNSSNATADSIYFESLNCTYSWWDDMFVLDTTTGPGSRPMNNFIGDKRVFTKFAAANDTVQWTPVASVTVAPPYSGSDTYSLSANTMLIASNIDSTMVIVAPRDCAITKTTLQVSGTYSGAKAKMFVYSEDPTTPGRPWSLLGTSDELTGLSTGPNDFTFTTPVSLTKGTKYFFGILSDTSLTLLHAGWYGPSGYGNPACVLVKSSTTYPTAPTPVVYAGFTTSLTNSRGPNFGYTYSTTNFANVQESEMDDGVTYNSSATVGNKDLFTVGPAFSTATQVWSIQLCGAYAKDDANARAIAQLIKSGSTETPSPDHTLGGSSFVFVDDLFVLNPDTGVEWTAAEANAMKIGYKVTV